MTPFESIQESAKSIGVDLDAGELATLAAMNHYSEDGLSTLEDVFKHLSEKKHEATVTTLLQHSRLPVKEPKSFRNFDFSQLHGSEVASLQSLPSLAALYAHRNLAFIGPQGVGKTHLAMAYGRACCERGMKTYFLKATELNQKLVDARRHGTENRAINGLVRPSCLIIDEIGHSIFDRESTRMFFDVIDRRYNKEGPNTIIFTSNSQPDIWRQYFSSDDDLLCALDRIFDNAIVFTIEGDSYRGKKRECITLTAGSDINRMH